MATDLKKLRKLTSDLGHPLSREERIAMAMENFVDLLNTKDSIEEFVQMFTTVVKFAKETRDLTNAELEAIKQIVSDYTKQSVGDVKESVETRLNRAIQDMQTIVRGFIDKATKEHRDTVNFLYDKVTALEDGIDGKDGKDADEEMIVAKVTKAITDIVTKNTKTTEETRAELGIDKLEKELQNVKSIRLQPGPGGARGIQLLVDGQKKGIVNYINLVAGTNVTLSYNRSNGRNDITISASGSGSFSVITLTGSVNDTNTAFTAASEPTLVVVNGVAYRNGFGVTISGTSVTLDNAPGTGGDVYGLG